MEMKSFNPCFPGSSAERKISRPLGTGGEVSILVFLDQALKASTILRFLSRIPGFNPCFPGSSAESLKKGLVNPRMICFNPCFPGSSAERIGLQTSWNDCAMFQSLFSWIKR